MEVFRKPYHWGKDYEAMCIHAAADADLLDPNSWTVSRSLPLDPKWFPFSMSNAGYLEGNMVEGPSGEVYNILRLNSMPEIGNKAVRLLFDQRTNSFSFDKLLDFPGGHTKFVIHRDPVDGWYWTLSNLNTDAQFTDQRNVLVLAVSRDTTDWHVLQRLLYDDTGLAPSDSIKYTGFHYVDWQFDGELSENIVYAIRTSYRGANSYHNSNRLTYKRLANYHSYANGLLGIIVDNATLSPPFERTVFNYSVTIPANSTVLQVSLAVLDGSSPTINGQTLHNGSKARVQFPETEHTITVTVRDADQTYTIHCKKALPSMLRLSGSGFELGTMQDGSIAWLNRHYVWKAVPTQIAGFRFTRISGGCWHRGCSGGKD
eukprot:SAG31_NODE_1270_length_9065_cov_7.007473_2_plen_373_part_00